MRISDWSSDVCSSDLGLGAVHQVLTRTTYIGQHKFNYRDYRTKAPKPESEHAIMEVPAIVSEAEFEAVQRSLKARSPRSEEHTSELQSLMRISYAVFCLKTKKRNQPPPKSD